MVRSIGEGDLGRDRGRGLGFTASTENEKCPATEKKGTHDRSLETSLKIHVAKVAACPLRAHREPGVEPLWRADYLFE